MGALDQLLNDDPDIVIQTPHGPVLEAKWLRRYLGEKPEGQLRRPLPTPDLPAPGSGWVWSVYSQERLLEYAAELYSKACLAYEELATQTFQRFSWTLSLFSQRPISVLGVLDVRRGADGEGPPGIKFRAVPTHLMERAIADSPFDWFLATTGRCALRLAGRQDKRGFEPDIGIGNETLKEWMQTARDSSPFVSFSTVDSLLETNHDRAASEIALSWLVDDLKAIGMFSGSARLS